MALKSILFLLVLSIYHVQGQITVQNPNYKMPQGLQAPRVPSLADVRRADQLRTEQQNAALARQLNPSAEAQRQHLQEIQAELRQADRRNKPIQYEFPDNPDLAAQNYKASFKELSNMLEGQQDLSLKRAVFLAESPYLGNTLSYERFCSDIATEIDIFYEFMKKENLDSHNDIAKKYMLQRFFSDTLVMKDDKGQYLFTHYPYRYDFEDPLAKQDFRKMLVTKLLKDKKGQCHSMPLLYLIFAEELGIKAWLAYSPEHSYIKTQDAKGAWYNFETTNGHYSTDSWILSSGYVKAEALQSKIYMDTISRKETIATCLRDLMMGYVAQFGWDKFVLNATDKVLQYKPKDIYALMYKSDYYLTLLKYVGHQMGYPPLKYVINNDPQAQQFFLKLQQINKIIIESGYEEMPENTYQTWLRSFEKEKAKNPTLIIRP